MPRDFRQYVREHLPPLAIRAEREVEIVDELALQLEEAHRTALARGASDAEAMQHAASEVPDWQALARTLTEVESIAPLHRTPHIVEGHVMTGFVQDLRRAVRGLLWSPGYTAVAIATLALGLGLGGAAFSLIDGVLVRPLVYPGAARLVLVKATVPPEGQETPEITLPDAFDIARSGIFESTAAALPYAGTTTLTDPPSRIEGFEVSPSFFRTLGVETIGGRIFNEEDGAPGREPVAMISHSFWQRLGAPADVVGRSLSINEVTRTIVGVVPPEFRIDLMPLPADVFVPLLSTHPFAANRGLRAFRVIGRLGDGSSEAQATAALETLGSQLAREYPATNRERTFRISPLQEEIVGPVRSQLWLVGGLVALVLLVAAVNLAGLMLTRAVGKSRELALRLALGARPWRLARESLAEGLILSGTAALLAAVLARAALDALRITPGLVMPRLPDVTVTLRTGAALVVAATVIAGVAGLVPMLLSRRLRDMAALRTGHETAGRPAIRIRAALIVGQTSLAFLLLAAATLLALSLREVLGQRLGFETNDVVTMRIAVPEGRYPARDDTVRFYTEVLESLRAHPAIRNAGIVSNLPLTGSTGSTLTVQGRDEVPLALRPTVGWNWASVRYFATMGIPIVRGRDFEPADVSRSSHVTVINETLARLHFPGEDPIGKRVYFGGFGPGGPPEWHEIIGVVGDVRHRQIDQAPDARAYDLFGQHWGRTVSLAARTSGNAAETAGIMRRLLAERDRRLAVFSIRTTADLVSNAVATRRLLLTLVSLFAGVGLAIASIGLYGTVSYIVAQRTRELGVRLALGATTGEIRRLVLASGLQIVGAGVLLGLVFAFALRSRIEPQLLAVTVSNPVAFALAAGTLLIAAAAACLVPAARAMRVNPVDALRAE